MTGLGSCIPPTLKKKRTRNKKNCNGPAPNMSCTPSTPSSRQKQDTRRSIRARQRKPSILMQSSFLSTSTTLFSQWCVLQHLCAQISCRSPIGLRTRVELSMAPLHLHSFSVSSVQYGRWLCLLFQLCFHHLLDYGNDSCAPVHVLAADSPWTSC